MFAWACLLACDLSVDGIAFVIRFWVFVLILWVLGILVALSLVFVDL